MLSAVLLALVSVAMGGWFLADAASPTTTKPSAADYREQIDEVKKHIDYLEKVIGGMARQMMLQQLFVEERIRSDGDSGLKQIRLLALISNTPDRRQSKTLSTIDERESKIDRNSVFDCHLSPMWRHMAIENSVSNDF